MRDSAGRVARECATGGLPPRGWYNDLSRGATPPGAYRATLPALRVEREGIRS